MEDFRTSDIKQLINLLNLDELNSDQDEFHYKPTEPKNLHSREFGTVPDVTLKQKSKNDFYSKSKVSKNIWSDDEIFNEDYDEIEMKEKPDYEMVHQQNVTPNDILLKMDGKGPGTNSCEGLLVKIKLDSINSKDEINLKISTFSLICKTKKHYLDLNFPREVDPEKCCAKWNNSINILELKLSFLEREQLF